MLSSLASGVTGLDSFQQQMDVIGNNIANVNTTGYKASVMDFADAFANTLNAPSSGSSTANGTNTMQIGTGVKIASINSNWTQGAISSTGDSSDLAVSGNGFFVVKDTVTGATYATRDGHFTVDNNGYLITSTGDRVQGYSNSGLSTLGDIKIDSTGAADPTASVTSYSVNASGQITVSMSDASTFTRGQILLQNFQDPDKLVNEGNNLYSNMSGAGALSASSAPGTAGLGTLQAGALELSNVDLSNEMANLITAQRAFEANSKIITTSDEALQTVVNMKR